MSISAIRIFECQTNKFTRQPDLAIEDAIRNGGLSGNPGDNNYYGNYRYIESTKQTDIFLNRFTKEYLTLPR